MTTKRLTQRSAFMHYLKTVPIATLWSARASDTDVAVILLYHCNKFQSRLWMDIGTTAKNNRRYICLTAIVQELGPDLCAPLPAFHSFTGSDYTSSFIRKGKVRPFKIFEKRPEYQNAFTVMARDTQVSDATKTTLLNFIANVLELSKTPALSTVDISSSCRLMDLRDMEKSAFQFEG
ncbi:hypothetical protein Pmani_031162 [Petrolisthes manimaculis]|uniref:Uncharacterized protein n=1 Tax=Petrolisthes manimaculis TaxID=1843537 RepID=A0AAE1TSS5_9EUCA|nr:hypothetical protein Pmani_031162 [Petrolisthes manimaculis]